MKKSVIAFLLLVISFVFFGCGGGTNTANEATSDKVTYTGKSGSIPPAQLGSEPGTVDILFVDSKSSYLLSNLEKILPYKPAKNKSSSLAINIEILGVNIVEDDGGFIEFISDKTIISVAGLADINFMKVLDSKELSAGNYSGLSITFGEITIDGETSEEIYQNLLSSANKTILLENKFSIKSKGSTALPFYVNESGFFKPATQFSTLITMLPFIDIENPPSEKLIFTTGDLLGFASYPVDGVGNIYNISDEQLESPVGTYRLFTSQSQSGRYELFNGINGVFTISDRGVFDGDSTGFFAMNGSFNGGYWINVDGRFGTFSIPIWLPGEVGTWQKLNSDGHGILVVGENALDGSWWEIPVLNNNSNGKFKFNY